MAPARTILIGVGKAAGGLTAMLLIVAWMSGFFEHKVPPGESDADHASFYDGPFAEVISEQAPVLEEAVGTVQAARRTAVSAKFLARILAVKVSAGDHVSAGDVLVELDARDLEARVAQARQAVEAAKAARDRAVADFERLRRLYENDNLSRSDYEAARAASEMAVAGHEAALQALEEARVAQSDAVIRAPVSGRIVERLAEPGDIAAPGQPLMHLYDPGALRLEVLVRESLATRLAVGATVEVVIDALQEQLFGVIDQIVPQAEAGARAFLVKAALPAKESLYTGMFGRLRLRTGQRARLAIPRQAVQEVGQLSFVHVVDADGRARRRLVTLGPWLEDGRIEALSGLDPGERVALNTAAAY